MKDKPFLCGMIVGLMLFSALAAAALLVFPELLYVIREINKLLTGSAL